MRWKGFKKEHSRLALLDSIPPKEKGFYAKVGELQPGSWGKGARRLLTSLLCVLGVGERVTLI